MSLNIFTALTGHAYENAVSDEKNTHKETTMNVEESSPWEFAIGVGSGERDNILVSSENININAFIHIAYFGDKFFFDNGDFGYFLTDNSHWNINLIAGPNTERQFFENFNRLGVQLSPSSNFAGSTGALLDGEEVIFVKPTNRDQTFDVGLELIGTSNWGEFQFQLNTDISNKHNGFELWSGYSYNFDLGSFEIRPSFGLIYKSEQWTNYFYGVQENEAIQIPNENEYIRSSYDASSSLNTFYKILLAYTLTEQLKMVVVFENEKLGHSIQNSPIVNKSEITTQFVGFVYEF